MLPTRTAVYPPTEVAGKVPSSGDLAAFGGIRKLPSREVSETLMSRAVVVLGGNAFVTAGQRLTMDGQIRFAHDAVARLRPLLSAGTQLLISHGNGPQVGHMLIRVEESLGKAYSVPLEVCVAETEGELGYVLDQALCNVLTELQQERRVAVLLTQVIVAESDPAFLNPSKPIGVFYTEEQAELLRRRGFAVREDAGRGYRRVVPSPRPKEVVELEVIRSLLSLGVIVVAAGGGGIPVVRSDSRLRGVEAVIDKDLTAALRADQLQAELLLILTDVPCVYRDFQSAAKQPIRHLTPEAARSLIADGQFAEGSMLPKVEAAAQFARQPGRRAIICNAASLEAALCGAAGTLIQTDSTGSDPHPNGDRHV